MIKIGRRGSLSGKIEVSGTQGHIAYPHLSNNPINTLVKICKKLNEQKLDKGNKNFQPSNLEITSINVDSWHICKPACECGTELNVPVFKFLKDAIIRSWGLDFFNHLDFIYNDFFNKKN